MNPTRTFQPVSPIKKLQKELEDARRGPLTDKNIVAQKEIQVRLELLMEQEEITWIQSALTNWLKHGDHNTNFFISLHLAGKK